jgi:hypothetical protein
MGSDEKSRITYFSKIYKNFFIEFEILFFKKKPSIKNRDVLVDTSKNEKGQQVLDPNHTHFLLMDDGTYYGYEIGDYRTRFVNEVSKYRGAHGID